MEHEGRVHPPLAAAYGGHLRSGFINDAEPWFPVWYSEFDSNPSRQTENPWARRRICRWYARDSDSETIRHVHS